jgi:hypothetical protein
MEVLFPAVANVVEPAFALEPAGVVPVFAAIVLSVDKTVVIFPSKVVQLLSTVV